LEYWENCKRALAKLPDNITWTFEGPIESSKLPEFLLANHLYILPTKGENFGHTIFEAFVAGRPVLISDQTPWLGLQKEGVGWDLPLSNEEAFSASIDFAAGWSQDEFDAYARASWSYAAKYVREIGLKQQYFELFS
jgi:glycosyltransferase involved in cell wall biosynthesis